jgi:hypothetical protein
VECIGLPMLTIWWEGIEWKESYSIGFAEAQQQAVGLQGKVECIGLPMLAIWWEGVIWEERYSIFSADDQ